MFWALKSQTMFAFFKNLWLGLNYYPWSRTQVESLRPLRISICPESRFAECMRLYDENIPYGVPEIHREEYLTILSQGQLLTFIAEDEDNVVGTFGVQYGAQQGTYWLCYLLISPEHHRKRIGTTLFFASMGILPEDHRHLTLAIVALPHAAEFYKRLGFLRLGDITFADGEPHQVATLTVWKGRAKQVRTWLSAAGVRLPDLGYDIPTAKVTPPPAPSAETPTRPPSLQ